MNFAVFSIGVQRNQIIEAVVLWVHVNVMDHL